MIKRLRALVIDDSAYNRQVIGDILAGSGAVEVVGKAFDGEEGLKLAAQLAPELITLDIEMPRMDGFTFLRLLMHQQPTPVIVISSHSRKEEVFQALELGALDFVAKPGQHIAPDLEPFRSELLAKVDAVRALQVVPRQRSLPAELPGRRGAPVGPLRRLIVVGASTGGPPALEVVFRGIGTLSYAAVVVAQHMPEKFTRAFAERLNRMVPAGIVEAEDGMPLAPGQGYIGAGGRHLELSLHQGAPVLRLSGAAAEDRYIPSVDRLFASAARAFGRETLAVVLTGMGNDGREGVRAVRAAGGRVLAESPDTCVVYGMPKEAVATGCVDEELPLPLLVERMVDFGGEGKAG